MGTPARFPERVRAAQSMGEWPGESRTLPRGFGTETAVPFGERLELMRCWLPMGGPRLGKGPVPGRRRDDAELGGGARCTPGTRVGGAIRLAADFFAGSSAGFGGGAMEDARCALLSAGKLVTGGEGGSNVGSKSSPSDRENVGTSFAVMTGSALGVLSLSSWSSAAALESWGLVLI